MVVAAVWGTEFIKFLAALAIWLFRTWIILKNRGNLSFSFNLPGAIHPILQIVLVQNSLRDKEFNKFYPPISSDDLSLSFCLFPFYMTSPYRRIAWIRAIFISFFATVQLFSCLHALLCYRGSILATRYGLEAPYHAKERKRPFLHLAHITGFMKHL